MGHGAEGRRGRRPADQPIEAFFGSDRDWPATMFVVVNDGLRQGIRMGRAWGTTWAGVAKVNHVSRSARSPFPVDLLLVHRS
jgi:hypothetical protein